MQAEVSFDLMNDNKLKSNTHQVIKVDVILKMITNIIRKEDEGKQCICSYKQVSNDCFTEEEVIPGLEVPLNKEGQIELVTIISNLIKLGYPLIGAMVQVFSYNIHQYVKYGNNLKQSILIKEKDLMYDNVIKLKCTCFIDEKQTLKSTMLNEQGANSDSEFEDEIKSSTGKPKKHKERKIGYVIEKVNLWRKLYNGYYNEENKFIKLSLLEAAKQIKVPKKTLDDYLRQLRLGRKFGYDFNKNIDTKIGDLREFVKNKNHPIKKINKKKCKTSDSDNE